MCIRDSLMSLPLGRNEIQGDDVYANVLEYDTVPACEKELEAHRDYFDVQFVASGEELLQFADCEGLETVQAYDEADDYCLLKTPEPVTSIVLRAGELAIFAPEDAHKPGCALGEPCHVRKIVVKVRA